MNTRTTASTNLARINPLLLPLPWLVVVLLMLVFAALRYSGNDGSQLITTEATKQFPHTFITDVDMRHFSNAGSIDYQLTSPLIRLYQVNERASSEDYMLFTTPLFTLVNNPSEPAWYVTANEGRRDANGTWFTLTGDVFARQTTKAQGEITLNTEELRLNTQEQFAESDKAVTMRAAKTQTTAIGLRADIKSNHIKLLSKVKGTYEP